jgi:hypothetical protein
MSIASRAVKESKAVADLAVAAAKNELIEQLTPSIQRIVQESMRAGTLGQDISALKGEGVNRMRQAAHGYDGISDFEEGKDMEKDDKEKVESVSALFPTIAEEADEAMDEGFEDMEEGADAVEETAEVEEELELSNEELEAMYNESHLLEVEVKKGFSDMAKPHEFGAGAKGQYQSDPANLADYQGGEKEWDDVDPPAIKKWTVEQLRVMAKKGMAENRALAAQNAKLKEDIKRVVSKLSEMNLLNTKILHVNKFMSEHRLNTEQRKSVIESIDRASTVKEVRSIYSVLQSSFKAAGVTNESVRRAPRADAQKRRTSGAPDTRVLRESADKAEGSSGLGRWQQLAGLTNGKR